MQRIVSSVKIIKINDIYCPPSKKSEAWAKKGTCSFGVVTSDMGMEPQRPNDFTGAK